MSTAVWFVIVALVGIGVGYGFRGWINRTLRKGKNKVDEIV